MRPTQNSMILRFLTDFGSITPMDALDFGIMRLASRISDLEKLGYHIRHEMEEGTNKYGYKVRYMRYYLEDNHDKV